MAEPLFYELVIYIFKMLIVGDTWESVSLSFQLKCAREAAKFAATGSAIGAISTAGLAWKYSKSPHGIAIILLSFFFYFFLFFYIECYVFS